MKQNQTYPDDESLNGEFMKLGKMASNYNFLDHKLRAELDEYEIPHRLLPFKRCYIAR